MISGIQAVTAELSNIALITPSSVQGYQPINPSGGSNPPAFLFTYEGENRGELRSDSTDHYIEDNSAIQDHIALPPIKFTVHGFIGEVSDSLHPVGAIVSQISNALVPISSFAPSISVTALNALNQAAQAYQAADNLANAATSAWNSLNGGGVQNNQQTAFQWWSNARLQRTLFNIQTPWAVLQNALPESIVPVQDAETNSMTDFFITFKELRFANTESTAITTTASGRAGQNLSPTVELGSSTPVSSISVGDAVSSVTGGN